MTPAATIGRQQERRGRGEAHRPQQVRHGDGRGHVAVVQPRERQREVVAPQGRAHGLLGVFGGAAEPVRQTGALDKPRLGHLAGAQRDLGRVLQGQPLLRVVEVRGDHAQPPVQLGGERAHRRGVGLVLDLARTDEAVQLVVEVERLAHPCQHAGPQGQLVGKGQPDGQDHQTAAPVCQRAERDPRRAGPQLDHPRPVVGRALREDRHHVAAPQGLVAGLERALVAGGAALVLPPPDQHDPDQREEAAAPAPPCAATPWR